MKIKRRKGAVIFSYNSIIESFFKKCKWDSLTNLQMNDIMGLIKIKKTQKGEEKMRIDEIKKGQLEEIKEEN